MKNAPKKPPAESAKGEWCTSRWEGGPLTYAGQVATDRVLFGSGHLSQTEVPSKGRLSDRSANESRVISICEDP